MVRKPTIRNLRFALVALVLSLAIAAGCRPSGSRVAPVVAAEAEARVEPVEQPDVDAPAVDGGAFAFPSDSGGKILERALPPGRPAGFAAERRTAPLERKPLPAVENPELPPAATPLDLPKLASTRGKAVRPRSLPDAHVLDSFRHDPLLPERLELPPTVLLRQPALNANVVPLLPMQARQLNDRAGLDDPTADLSAQRAIAAEMPLRTATAGFWRFVLPEPPLLRGPSPDASVEVMAPVMRPLR